MAENQTTTTPTSPNHFESPFPFDITTVKGISTPFAYRKIDAWLIPAIFQREEYKLPDIKGYKPKLILDCGGNIGCSAVYFANKYPDAQIYSIEPHKNNFKLLVFNMVFYENIHPINSGLWDKESFVSSPGDGNASSRTFEAKENDPTAVKTVTVSQLLRDSGFDEIDLLKIDIEGAEKEVFSAPDVDEWLPKVKVLTIELHDRYKRGCSYAFFKAISKYHWFHAYNGENIILIRGSLMP